MAQTQITYTDKVVGGGDPTGQYQTVDANEVKGVVNTNASDAESRLGGLETDAVTAALDIADNALIRGDGGVKGAQQSGISVDDLNNITNVTEITATDIPLYKAVGNILTTGIYDGGGIVTVNVDTTKFDVSDGQGVITTQDDAENPGYIPVSWTGKTAISIANPANIVTYVYIDAAGDVIQTIVPFTRADRRDKIILAVIATSDGVNINGISDFSHNVSSSYLSSDMFNAVGDINMSGNQYTNAGANLLLDRSAGETARENINRSVDMDNPHRKVSVADPGCVFNYIYSDGASGFTLIPGETNIDPDQYDDGSGTLAAVPNNNFTNIICYYLPGTIINVLQYGNEIYGNYQAAIDAIPRMNIEPLGGLRPSDIRTIITVREGSTNLDNEISLGRCAFTPTGKFGFGTGGGGGGGGTLTNTDQLPEGAVNLYYTEARVSANTSVLANTAKVGVTNEPASDPSGVTGADAITNMMSLTQAEYDAIVTPDAETFYIITDA